VGVEGSPEELIILLEKNLGNINMGFDRGVTRSEVFRLSEGAGGLGRRTVDILAVWGTDLISQSLVQTPNIWTFRSLGERGSVH